MAVVAVGLQRGTRLQGPPTSKEHLSRLYRMMPLVASLPLQVRRMRTSVPERTNWECGSVTSGLTVSRTIEADWTADQVPAPSPNWTYTERAPLAIEPPVAGSASDQEMRP